MKDRSIVDGATLESIHRHLSQAQELMDKIRPNSIFGARLQHLLDEIAEEMGVAPRQLDDLGS